MRPLDADERKLILQMLPLDRISRTVQGVPAWRTTNGQESDVDKPQASSQQLPMVGAGQGGRTRPVADVRQPPHNNSS